MITSTIKPRRLITLIIGDYQAQLELPEFASNADNLYLTMDPDGALHLYNVKPYITNNGYWDIISESSYVKYAQIAQYNGIVGEYAKKLIIIRDGNAYSFEVRYA